MANPVQSKLASEAIDRLQELIQLNIDSRDGFREAAQQVEDPVMKREFLFAADQHSTLAAELQHYVVVNEENPVTTGSFLASLRRSWEHVRQSFSSQDAFATLARVERSEAHAQAAYEATLQLGWDDAEVRTALRTQHNTIKALHDRMRGLKDSHQPRD